MSPDSPQLLLPKAKLVIRTFSQLSQEVQDSLLRTDQCSSPEDILEKSGYNKAEQQQKLRDQASTSLLPQERQKRPYSHTTVGLEAPRRGIEATWAGRQAQEKVLKENGVNALTTPRVQSGYFAGKCTQHSFNLQSIYSNYVMFSC